MSVACFLWLSSRSSGCTGQAAKCTCLEPQSISGSTQPHSPFRSARVQRRGCGLWLLTRHPPSRTDKPSIGPLRGQHRMLQQWHERPLVEQFYPTYLELPDLHRRYSPTDSSRRQRHQHLAPRTSHLASIIDPDSPSRPQLYPP